MDEKELDKTMQEATPPVASDSDQISSIRTLVAEIEPDGEDVVEVVKRIVERAKKDRAVNDRLVQAFEKEPRLSSIFLKIANGDDSAAFEFGRTFGRTFSEAEEGTPEYEDFMRGEQERKAEIAREEEAKALLDKNLDASDEVIDAYCKENNLDADKFREEIDQLLMPIMDGTLTMEACKILDKGLHYDKDTKDAYDAGVVEGRNTNINAMRDDLGDGLPKGLTSEQVQTPRRRGNSLIDMALQA